MSDNASVIRTNDQLEHALLSAWSTQADAAICAVDDSLRIVMLNQPFSDLVGAVKF